jgi:hypothetical protein
MPDAPDTAFHLVPTELFGALALPADPLARPPDVLILARVHELMHRANAAATLRAYRTGWAQWCAYCDEHGRHTPLAGRPEPVSFLARVSRTHRPLPAGCHRRGAPGRRDRARHPPPRRSPNMGRAPPAAPGTTVLAHWQQWCGILR